MTVRFILGRAGAGKTRVCLDGIRRAAVEDPLGPPVLFVVPEQASFQMERDLVTGEGPRALIRAQVLSFRRLAWRVFEEVGGPAHPPLGELGKQMALRSLLQKHQGELVFFRGATLTPGFTARLACTLSELKIYGVSPESLEEWLAEQRKGGGGGRVEAPALAKAQDLLLLYRDFQAYLGERFTDPDDYLDLLAQRLPRSSAMREATVWIDGFAGFTPQEVNVLRALFLTAPKVNVALCLDPSEVGLELSEVDLFAPTRETYDLLRQVAAQSGVAVGPSLELGRATGVAKWAATKADSEAVAATETATTATPATGGGGGGLPRFGHACLDHLESQWPRLAPAPYPATGSEDLPITLVAAANRRAEAEWVAREIVRLCRDCGYRYRDISVVLRTLQGYDHLIAGAFEECGVPLFIDRRRPVPHHPVIELVRSSVEALAGGWAAEPVLRLLKTDLFPVTRDAVDVLENYVLAHGVHGESWYGGGRWEFSSPPGTEGQLNRHASPEEQALEAAVNGTRGKIAGPLRRLAEAFGGRWTASHSVPVRRATAAVRGLLGELDVAGQLEAWAARETGEGHPLAAQEHLQVWNGISGLLEQLDEGLGDQPVSPEECLQILESGLAGLRLGLIPPGLDQVMVGSIERSRQPEIKACFVMGATDGVFPSSRGEDIVFSDRERSRLAEAGLRLAPTGRHQTLREKYFVYIALTRASQRLYVSYPLADEEGRGLAPSASLAGRLRQVAPAARLVTAGLEPAVGEAARAQGGGPLDGEEVAYLARPEQAIRHLARRLRLARGGGGYPPGPVWWAVYRWAREDPARRQAAVAVLSSLVHSNDVPRLPRDLVRRLHGLHLRGSVSRLEDFAACPFRYFAAHGLKLAERPEQQFKAPDMGQFFHAALQAFVRRLLDEGRNWADLGPRDVERMVGEAVEKVAPTIQSRVLIGTARRRYLAVMLRRTLTRSVKMLGEHARRGRFAPVAVELRFGLPPAPEDGGVDLPGLTIRVNEDCTLMLRGIIDRVDVARSGGGWYLRIIDYKSSKRSLNFQRIREGLALQLLVYALVALEHHQELCARPGTAPAPSIAAVQYFAIGDPMVPADGPLLPAEVEARRTKDLKMTGLVLDDPAVWRLLDDSPDGGKRSDLFTRTTVSPEELQAVLAFTRKKVAELAQGIFQGEAAIRPWRQGALTACSYCPFGPVCSFDALVPGCAYRDLPSDAKAAKAAIVGQATEGGDPPHGR